MAKAEPMDPEFAVWMSEFEVEPDSRLQAARWKAIQAVTARTPTMQTECWVTLAFRMQRLKPDEEARAVFAEAFRKADATFDPRHGRQLQVLACIGLALRLKGSGDYANEAALAILAAAVNGARTEVSSLHLVERAKEHLEREIQRRGAGFAVASHLKGAFSDLNLAPTLAKLTQPADPANVAATLREVATSIQVHFARTQAASLQAAAAIDAILARQEQELAMHWWLTGGRSTHLKTWFTAMDDRTRPLVLASELSEMTHDKLGPASVYALLARAGVSEARKISIPEAVMACDPELLDWLAEGKTSPMTTPIHFAILRQKEMGPGNDWVTPWSKVTEIEADHSMSEVDFALQFYREKRLLHLADKQ
ncbi:GTPase-associated system all-helical protein GASH [uncultured Methylobacterium sp.]|uniref:GTPase-associated system all-helical protein GASH n=1 Tax=uncultured Methylobacterium sp. TaxID=157278 RepID=UPI002595D855|nr:GTPase-associated system all-helical protein GASH [uncultured Methylobacterium sp.]